MLQPDINEELLLELEKQEQELKRKIQEEQQRKNKKPYDAAIDYVDVGRPLSPDLEEFKDFSVDLGYKRIPLQNLPTKGFFYPHGTTVAIRSANVGEIKHFSTIDDTDLIDVHEKMNMIIKSCVRIRNQRGVIVDTDFLKDIDKYYLIFAIRELSDIYRSEELVVESTCNSISCKKPGKINVSKESFTQLQQNETFEKFYSAENRSFIIEMNTGDQLEFFVPSIGVSTFLRSYVANLASKGKKLEKEYIAIIKYLINTHVGLNEDSIQQYINQIQSWSIEKYIVAYGVATELNQFLDIKLSSKCTCGVGEVVAPIQFQRGYKSIFIISDWTRFVKQ